jgi:hypothetical protein
MERQKHLATLFQMAAQERWASDFYLFGVSPFYIDLRNLVGELTEMAQASGRFTERHQPTAQQLIPYPLVESVFRRKLEKAGVRREIREKVASLDGEQERESFLALKEMAVEIQKSLGSEEVVIYNQFEGKTLKRYRGVQGRPRRRGNTRVSLGEWNSVYSGEEKRASVRCSPSGSLFQKRP